MAQGSQKLAIAVLIFVGVWIGVYWSLSPRSTSNVTFADGGDALLDPTGLPDETNPNASGKLVVSEPRVAPPGLAPAGESGGGSAAVVGDELRVSGETAAPPPEVVSKPKPAPRQPAVIPPSFQDYTIQPGDTLPSISRRFYGTPNYASAIARANPFMNAAKLKPGREIKIPKDPGNIQGKPNPSYTKPEARGAETTKAGPKPGRGGAAKSEGGDAAERPVVPGAAKPAAGREYTVRSGDTLSKISKQMYGETRFAGLIFEANRDTLASPDSLKIGQKLKIPAKPAD